MAKLKAELSVPEVRQEALSQLHDIIADTRGKLDDALQVISRLHRAATEEERITIKAELDAAREICGLKKAIGARKA